MDTTIGPRLTDERLFGELLDTAVPGLSGIPAAAAAGDYKACRHMLAEHLRATLQPERYFQIFDQKVDEDVPADFTMTDTDEETIRKADEICRHYIYTADGICDFGDKPIDWFVNPTYNQYCEWPWGFNRHWTWRLSARAYRLTGDEKYAESCAEQFDSWVKQALSPVPPCGAGATISWRTIETGIRMAYCWPEIIHTFLHSPAFTDDILTDWCKSVWEHGERLRRDHVTGNWLIMEMAGLFCIGLLYPFFKDSAAWFSYGQAKLREELRTQVYPDGMQYELTTNYQMVVIIYYMITVRMSRAYDRPVDPETLDTLEKLLLAYAGLVRPNGTTPDINDGYEYSARAIIARAIDMYPENEVFRWVVSKGKEGVPPAKDSTVFPYAGLAALRTGWGKEDTFLFFDGGPFGKAHQHEDKLQVLLCLGENNILTEAKRYAYDTSAMRQYSLGTHAHSTVLVDGMGQNRRKTYTWQPEDIEKKSDLQYKLNDAVDAARAVYDEGYGDEPDKTVTHERSVYFFKKPEGVQPFAVVVDRLTADRERDYEVQWMLDTKQLAMNGLQVTAGPLRLLVSEAPMETAGLRVACGQQFPELQGWLCNSMQLKDYRPIPAVRHTLHGQNIRWVTVLCQDDIFTGVEASLDVNDRKITLKKADGTVFALDEADLL